MNKEMFKDLLAQIADLAWFLQEGDNPASHKRIEQMWSRVKEWEEPLATEKLMSED